MTQAGQVYPLDNPPSREPLRRGHTNPRPLGRRGAAPGLKARRVHLNRVIKHDDPNMIHGR
jgi:phosphoketolase